MLRVFMEERTAAEVWPQDVPGRWLTEPSWPRHTSIREPCSSMSTDSRSDQGARRCDRFTRRSMFNSTEPFTLVSPAFLRVNLSHRLAPWSLRESVDIEEQGSRMDVWRGPGGFGQPAPGTSCGQTSAAVRSSMNTRNIAHP